MESLPAMAFVAALPTARRKYSPTPILPRREGTPLCCLTPAPRVQSSPSQSLRDGTWFKMICGASSQDLPRIRNLAMLYAIAGADCIDAAADPAVVSAVREGFKAASTLRVDGISPARRDPWLMISVNVDEDPHFRKAIFDPAMCPPACPRPCEAVCPANAIDISGVIPDVCYGCGRCIPICPEDLVSAIPFVHTTESILDLLAKADAVEIHTRSEHAAKFARLWSAIGPTAVKHMKAVAVSFPDPGSNQELSQYLRRTSMALSTLPDNIELIWQTDGRPMSGDIGRGTAKASVKLASRVRDALLDEGIRGHVQLAGGTNDATGPLLGEADLLTPPRLIAGAAFGGYARKVCVLHPVLTLKKCYFSLELRKSPSLTSNAHHLFLASFRIVIGTFLALDAIRNARVSDCFQRARRVANSRGPQP